MNTIFKKLLTAMLAVAMVASISACGAKPAENAETNASTVTDAAKADIDWKYTTPEQTKEAIEKSDPMILLDIQVKEDFDAHHLKGAVPTYAYPADTAELTAKIDVALEQINACEDPVFIVCPGGGSGAKRTYKYLMDKGIKEERLFIVKDGQKGWKYDELVEKTAA